MLVATGRTGTGRAGGTAKGASAVPVVGMVGGGQLARMTQQAAIGLGIEFRVLAERPEDSAARVTPAVTIGDHRDLSALRAFAAGCDVVTFDHEHVPPEHIRALQAEGVVVHPNADALRYAQDKLLMRDRLTELGIPCPEWSRVESVAELPPGPSVLKASTGGYDGRGVWLVDSPRDPAVAEAFASGSPVLREQQVDFTRELAAVVARSPYGQAIAYPVVESVQREGICHEVIAPAPGLSEDAALRAQRIALRIADELGVVGVLAVELFQTAADEVLVNELAMRPHNSGHWTIDGAVTSQFENHLRAVLDLPLGKPSPRAEVTVMVNLLGGTYTDMHGPLLHCFARDPGLRLHLYGKDVRPGRKVGHVTCYGSSLREVRTRARHAADYLTGRIDD